MNTQAANEEQLPQCIDSISLFLFFLFFSLTEAVSTTQREGKGGSEREREGCHRRTHSLTGRRKQERNSVASSSDRRCKGKRRQMQTPVRIRGIEARSPGARAPSSVTFLSASHPLSLSLDDDVDEAAGAAAASHQEFKCNLILTSAVLLLLQRQSGRRGGRKIQGIKSFRQTLTKRRRRKHALSLSQAHAWQHSRSHGERGRSGIESVLTHQTLGIRSTNFQST